MKPCAFCRSTRAKRAPVLVVEPPARLAAAGARAVVVELCADRAACVKRVQRRIALNGKL